MSSTNKTTNLELSQFIGSDSPKWLTDYNADMEKIDTGYQTVKAQADATDLIVGGHTSSLSSLQSTVTEQGTAITGLRTDVTANSGSINTINSLIGNGEPTTTDKTLIGAINEIQSEFTALLGYTIIGEHTVTVSHDGTKTNADLIEELHAAISSYISSINDDVQARIENFSVGSVYYLNQTNSYYYTNNSSVTALTGIASVPGSNGLSIRSLRIYSSTPYSIVTSINSDTTITYNDYTSNIASSDMTARIILFKHI